MSRHRLVSFVAALGLAAALAPLAHAGDHDRASRVASTPEYRQECGTCHVPYPPGLLSASSWQRLMGDLPHHFGADASLEAPAQARLVAWLAANAGSGRRVIEAPPEDRITRSPWFVREHREVPTAAWARPAIKRAANCAACHPGAEQGDFSEHGVRVPR